jgi:uncharacterized protein (DUF433 family)
VNGLGAYEADRASALSGVPESTLYLWARETLVAPSISPEKIKLWSWADLVTARAIYWLRHPAEGGPRKPTTMARVRDLLHAVDALADRVSMGELLGTSALQLYVDPAGVPHVEIAGVLREGRHGYRQMEHRDVVIDLLAEFAGQSGAVGPDLRRPARFIEIVPDVLSGEPHVEATRIPTRGLAALAERGFRDEQIVSMYPGIRPEQVASAVALEKRLMRNLQRLAA